MLFGLIQLHMRAEQNEMILQMQGDEDLPLHKNLSLLVHQKHLHYHSLLHCRIHNIFRCFFPRLAYNIRILFIIFIMAITTFDPKKKLQDIIAQQNAVTTPPATMTPEERKAANQAQLEANKAKAAEREAIRQATSGFMSDFDTLTGNLVSDVKAVES